MMKTWCHRSSSS